MEFRAVQCLVRSNSDKNSDRFKSLGEIKILEGFGKLFENQSHCDIQFLFKTGETVGGHVAVLSAGSPVFAAMLHSDFVEARTGKIQVKAGDFAVFYELLTYLYTGSSPKLKNPDITQKLYELADLYDVKSLRHECVNAIATGLTFENVLIT